jgi:DNA-binding winged helix-turn-helix (wHTH) protein
MLCPVPQLLAGWQAGIRVPEDPSRSVVRFGDFELDLRSRELRKRGVRIALQERPLQVLEVLLRTPGELVTREALQHELWGGDTFVDFETGLNAAVRRLREALGDVAGVPRFVETLPRRGYRFIGPVHGAARQTPHQAEMAAPAAAEAPSTPPSPAPSPRSSWKPGTRYVVLVAVIAAGGVMALSRWAAPRDARPATPRIVPLTTTAGSEVTPTLSPDGTQVAFSWDGEQTDGIGDRDLWLRMIGGGQAVRRLTDGGTTTSRRAGRRTAGRSPSFACRRGVRRLPMQASIWFRRSGASRARSGSRRRWRRSSRGRPTAGSWRP